MMQKIDIVIVNWNTGDLLAQCLQSLQEVNDGKLINRVVVIDNNSSDQSVSSAKRVVKSELSIDFILLEKNIGFAGANNVGLRKLNDDNHVLLLNPDTNMHNGALTGFMGVINVNKEAGIVGAQLLNPDGSSQTSVRRFPSLLVMIFLLLKLHRLFGYVSFWREYMMKDFDYTKQQAVDQVMGAAFLIRREVLDKIGLLDEKFFVWFEEVDYCWRVKEAGWKVIYTPQAKITHYGGVSFNQLIGWARIRPWIKSLRYYTYKNLGWGYGLVISVLIPLSLLIVLPTTIFHLWNKK